MNAVPLNKILINNSKLYEYAQFPIPVRQSARERVKWHSVCFALLNAAFSFGYHFVPLNASYAAKQAAKSLLHKGLIGFIFFYSNQIVWGWLRKQTNYKGVTVSSSKQKRVASWSSYLLTSVLLFPIFIGFNLIYRLPGKKTIMRSLVDVLLLNFYGLQFDRRIRNNRQVLTKGQQQQKRALFINFTS